MNSSEILKQLMEIDKGIIPSCVWYDQAGGINKDRWLSLSLDGKIKSKRKFRKLFRKACRRYSVEYRLIKDPAHRSWIVKKYIREFCEDGRL